MMRLSAPAPVSATHSVPDGVMRNGGVGTMDGSGSTEPGGNVRFSLFLLILLMMMW